MRNPVEIENIEGMRLRQGINDVELREEIAQLRKGDFVRLTLLVGDGKQASETVLVRLTYARDHAFRGELANPPTSSHFAGLQAGSPVRFAAMHIHSILRKGGPTDER